jgi:tetratricopeptide (TPR) repeat protein
MKLFCCCFLCFLASRGVVFGQDAPDAPALVKEGVKLNNAGKYAEAVNKYAEALKADSNNVYANYGMAFSLLNAGRGDEGINYLQKVIKANSSITAWAYDLLGSVYDKDHNPDKAIEAFNEGIKVDPKYQELYYNLALVYFRGKNYAQAEKTVIESIKLDPKHANSQRVYALVCFHQNKRANALLGFCSFLLLEPQGVRSTESFGNMQHIMQGGVLKTEPGVPAPAPDANAIALNNAITKAMSAGMQRQYPTAADRLAAQLTALFSAIGTLADAQTGDDFFKHYYADYFYKLAQSPNMAAFARLVSPAIPETDEWKKNNAAAMMALEEWVKGTERGF